MPHRTRLRTPLFARPGALAARQRAMSSSARLLQRPHLRAPHAASRRGSPTPATSATPTTDARRPHRQASRLSASSPAAAWRTCPHDSATGTCQVFQLNQFSLPYFFLASFPGTVLAPRQSSPQAQLLAPSSFCFLLCCRLVGRPVLGSRGRPDMSRLSHLLPLYVIRPPSSFRNNAPDPAHAYGADSNVGRAAWHRHSNASSSPAPLSPPLPLLRLCPSSEPSSYR